MDQIGCLSDGAQELGFTKFHSGTNGEKVKIPLLTLNGRKKRSLFYKMDVKEVRAQDVIVRLLQIIISVTPVENNNASYKESILRFKRMYNYPQFHKTCTFVN